MQAHSTNTETANGAARQSRTGATRSRRLDAPVAKGRNRHALLGHPCGHVHDAGWNPAKALSA
jgi:hypothetical protein